MNCFIKVNPEIMKAIKLLQVIILMLLFAFAASSQSAKNLSTFKKNIFLKNQSVI